MSVSFKSSHSSSTQAQLIGWCLLSSLALSGGFLPTTISNTKQAEAEIPRTKIKAAEFRRVIKYPFEIVNEAWENGPEDPNFIKEEVKTTRKGAEVLLKKTIYTKNPLPFLIKKTVSCREKFCLSVLTVGFRSFEMSSSCLMKSKQSTTSSAARLPGKDQTDPFIIALTACCRTVNRVLENICKAHRTFSLRADPSNPNWTLMEQSITVTVTDAFGGAIKSQLEKFAEGAFLSSCERGTDILEKSLASKMPAFDAKSLNKLSPRLQQQQKQQPMASQPPEDVRMLVGEFVRFLVKPAVIILGIASKVIQPSDHLSPPPVKEQPMAWKAPALPQDFRLHLQGKDSHAHGRKEKFGFHSFAGAAAAFVTSVDVY
eukprot:767767-Hanusia_phi.AAC.2